MQTEHKRTDIEILMKTVPVYFLTCLCICPSLFFPLSQHFYHVQSKNVFPRRKSSQESLSINTIDFLLPQWNENNNLSSLSLNGYYTYPTLK